MAIVESRIQARSAPQEGAGNHFAEFSNAPPSNHLGYNHEKQW
jgi:hypothetical protein